MLIFLWSYRKSHDQMFYSKSPDWKFYCTINRTVYNEYSFYLSIARIQLNVYLKIYLMLMNLLIGLSSTEQLLYSLPQRKGMTDNTCTCTCTYKFTYTCTCICTYTYMYMYICMCTNHTLSLVLHVHVRVLIIHCPQCYIYMYMY